MVDQALIEKKFSLNFLASDDGKAKTTCVAAARHYEDCLDGLVQMAKTVHVIRTFTVSTSHASALRCMDVPRAREYGKIHLGNSRRFIHAHFNLDTPVNDITHLRSFDY